MKLEVPLYQTLILATGLVSIYAGDDRLVTFVNDTKAPAVIHVVRTETASNCAPLPSDQLGSTSNTIAAGKSWQESHGTGCWSWSPGSENFDDKKLSKWCVMKGGETYRLNANTSLTCRVND